MHTAEQVIDAITKGTDGWRFRKDPKHIRVIHLTEKYALVYRKGGSYSCNGFTHYVSGSVDIVKLPSGLTTAGGFELWDTARHRDGTMTPKRLKWLIECIERNRLDVHAVRDEVKKRREEAKIAKGSQ